MRKILLTLALAAICASCAEETIVRRPDIDGRGVAYVSIDIRDSQRTTRRSDEKDGANEELLKSLCLLTFNAEGGLVTTPDGKCYSLIDVKGKPQAEARQPDPVKISSAAKLLIVVANPGAQLQNRLDDLTATSTFKSLNYAIHGSVSEVVSPDNYFTMITAGDDRNPVAGKVPYPWVEIGSSLQIVGGAVNEEKAIQNARNNRLSVNLERLAAKITVQPNPRTISAPKSAQVTLLKWEPDGVNGIFFPFAEKTLLSVAHTGNDYHSNFYTQDPNFTSANELLHVGSPGATSLPAPYGWRDPYDGHSASLACYVLENTVAADAQTYRNVTRVIIQARYVPNFGPVSHADTDDWFSWGGTSYYPSLAALQTGYSANGASSTLKDACDRFYAKVKAANKAIAAANFTALTQADLNTVANGGEAVKEGSKPVIRWFQKGMCYYSYEIRHDNETTEKMAFGKYGVVRNNWYDLTLNSVKGPGTPWFPNPDEPGPGDPASDDPIDSANGYLDVSVSVAPWVYWQAGMDDID